MPYRCQICKDCSDTEGVYQSDRDYPSEVSDSDNEHFARRWRRRYSRRKYQHRRGGDRTGYRRRTSEGEERRGHGVKEDDRNNRRTYRRRKYWTSKDKKIDNNDEIRSEGENYRRDNSRERYMRVTHGDKDTAEEKGQTGSIYESNSDSSTAEVNEKDNMKEYVTTSSEKVQKTNINKTVDTKTEDSDSDSLENSKQKKENCNREENSQETEDDTFWNCLSDSETETDTDTDSDSDENYGDGDAIQSSGREKRDAGHQKREHHGGNRQGLAKPRRRRSLNISYVKMPSGKRHPIITPKPKEFKCGTPTKRITLHRNGKMSGKEYKIVEGEMQNSIVHHKNCSNAGGCFSKYEIVKIEKLINGCIWKRYRHFQQDIIDEHGYANQRMLFHGSAKVEDILNTGFDERYSNFDGMFGAGLYFAKHSSKANQYAYGYMGGTGCQLHSDKNCHLCERKILLCRVTLGKSKNLYTGNNLAHPPAKHNSVVGVPSNQKGGLKYPEYIVYRGEQIYPEYMITYKIKDSA